MVVLNTLQRREVIKRNENDVDGFVVYAIEPILN